MFSEFPMAKGGSVTSPWRSEAIQIVGQGDWCVDVQYIDGPLAKCGVSLDFRRIITLRPVGSENVDSDADVIRFESASEIVLLIRPGTMSTPLRSFGEVLA
jgi:hypothetical protein